MKIICEKDTLLSALQIVQKATATKTTLPILTGIYLTAENGNLEMQATDYELGISVHIPVTVLNPGKVVLSGKIFPDIVRKISGKTIEISTTANSTMVSVIAGKSEFKILSFPPDEFPVIKRIESTNRIVIQDAVLKDLIQKTVFACSTDESRPLFTGALTELVDQKLVMVATNTHRLALKKIEAPAGILPLRIIIPGKLLTEIARVLNYENPIDVTLSWLKNQISLAFENIYIVSRIIEGQFPDYKKVIPTDFLASCILKASDLYDSVERVSLLARDGEYSIIRIKLTEGLMTLIGNNPDAGSATENVEVDYEGDILEIAFNARYLMDVLKVAGNASVQLHFRSALNPVMVNIVGDETFTYVLTPIRTH